MPTLRFQRGECREGERILWHLLALLPKIPRQAAAEQFGGQFVAAGMHKEAVEAWSFLAWAFATSPEPSLLNPREAMVLAQQVEKMTNQIEAVKPLRPVALDAVAAALAESNQ